MLRTHHDLKAWSLSRALVKDVYRLTAGFPDDERFGLDGDQLVLPDADGEHELRVPIDRQGRTLLNWHLDREHRARIPVSLPPRSLTWFVITDGQ